MNTPISTTLRTSTPCRCKRPVRIRATHHVPRELYDRTCSTCGTSWQVERRTARTTPDGGRIDIIEWTPRTMGNH